MARSLARAGRRYKAARPLSAAFSLPEQLISGASFLVNWSARPPTDQTDRPTDWPTGRLAEE